MEHAPGLEASGHKRSHLPLPLCFLGMGYATGAPSPPGIPRSCRPPRPTAVPLPLGLSALPRAFSWQLCRASLLSTPILAPCVLAQRLQYPSDGPSPCVGAVAHGKGRLKARVPRAPPGQGLSVQCLAGERNWQAVDSASLLAVAAHRRCVNGCLKS